MLTLIDFIFEEQNAAEVREKCGLAIPSSGKSNFYIVKVVLLPHCHTFRPHIEPLPFQRKKLCHRLAK
jgi:hypothetical protein